MKKLIALILAVIMTVALAGCGNMSLDSGNMSLGIGNFTYHKVHVDTYHYSGCFTVEKWYDGNTGIEVKTEEVGSMFLSEGTYVLLEGDKDCPFCGEGEDNG